MSMHTKHVIVITPHCEHTGNVGARDESTGEVLTVYVIGAVPNVGARITITNGGYGWVYDTRPDS